MTSKMLRQMNNESRMKMHFYSFRDETLDFVTRASFADDSLGNIDTAMKALRNMRRLLSKINREVK
jgi:hypothetical protein